MTERVCRTVSARVTTLKGYFCINLVGTLNGLLPVDARKTRWVGGPVSDMLKLGVLFQ
jgi:hypothetical protein